MKKTPNVVLERLTFVPHKREISASITGQEIGYTRIRILSDFLGPLIPQRPLHSETFKDAKIFKL
jgi:hypothetical protein